MKRKYLLKKLGRFITLKSNKLTLLSLFVVSLSMAESETLIQPEIQLAEYKINNRYIVKLKNNFIINNALTKQEKHEKVSSKAQVLATKSSSKVLQIYDNIFNGFVLESTNTQEITDLLLDPEVESISEDSEIWGDTIQRNPPSWGIDRIDQINLPLSNSYNNSGLDGTGVHVYVIDTGVTNNRSEFGERLLEGVNLYTGTGGGGSTGGCGDNSNPFMCNSTDVNGHGTHVAGTIGGSTYGVAKNAYLHSVRVLSSNASGSVSDFLAGIDWVIENKPSDEPSIANISIGTGQRPQVHDAINALINSGVTVVVSAGNFRSTNTSLTDNACLQDPASVPNAITVAASNRYDSKWANSLGSSKVGACVDIFAPGEDIVSIDIRGGSTEKTGTSMSAPHVSGAAALYLQNNPTAVPQEVTKALIDSASNGKISNINNSLTPNKLLNISGLVNSIVNYPKIKVARTTCNNKYCIRLAGDNIANNSYVNVRKALQISFDGEYIRGTAQYSGNDIYNRGPFLKETGYKGEALYGAHFPIRSIEQQENLRTYGLCFTVISNGLPSNESCLDRSETIEPALFMGKVVESYRLNSEDIEHTSYDVFGSAYNKLKIWGNSWKKIAYNYNVTRNTVLEFQFRSNQQEPEITGIGFIKKDQSTLYSPRMWQVHGIENWGNQEFNNYSGTDWKTYRIPIGKRFLGEMSEMVFIADEDNHVGQNVIFKNPKLFEDVKSPVPGFAYDPLKSGHGIHISQSSSSYLIYFYSYDANGNPEWFYGSPTYYNNQFSGSLKKVSYNHSTHKTSSSVVGSFTLDYSDAVVDNNSNCNGVNQSSQPGVFNWSINGQSGSWCMQPLFKNSDYTPSVPRTNSGVWYEPDYSGWGMSNQIHYASGDYSAYNVVYYYDSSGVGRWSSGYDSDAVWNNQEFSMFHYTGYPRTLNGSTNSQYNGSLDLNFGNNDTADLNLTYHVSPGGTWNRSNADIVQLTE